MSLAERVRGILAQRPLTKAEVVAVLGVKNGQARSCLNELCRSGMVERAGDVYSLGRAKVERTPATREKALARYERNRRAKGQRPRAEYLAELAATREARRVANLARRAERERVKRAAAAASRPVRVKAPKIPKPRREYLAPKASKSRAANQQPSVYRVLPSLPEAPQVRLMTSDEWLAMGGTIEVLKRGEFGGGRGLKCVAA